MPGYSTPAIVLRKTDFGDYDLILTLFTLEEGKTTVIAKSAKKSTKRFGGILELFSVLDVVYSTGRRKGFPVLQEAALKHPFPNIRSSMLKTAYASYWAELINEWMEDGQVEVPLFQLFHHVLKALDAGREPEASLSILFQMRFITIAGLLPNLRRCSICRVEVDKIKEARFEYNLNKGGIICRDCASETPAKNFLSKGTIKQLLWLEKEDLTTASRVKFASDGLKEGLKFLEAFVPYHMGKSPRSLKFLRKMRDEVNI